MSFLSLLLLFAFAFSFFHLTEGLPNLLLIILLKAYQCLDQCLNLFKEPVFYMADL